MRTDDETYLMVDFSYLPCIPKTVINVLKNDTTHLILLILL